MLTGRDYLVQQERYQDLMHEAEEARLAQVAQGSRRGIYWQTLGHLRRLFSGMRQQRRSLTTAETATPYLNANMSSTNSPSLSVANTKGAEPSVP
jgi:hypothetical protein